ncbi:MAG TPA: molybdopterin molybdotransferase MoeA [Candidatus Acidoferrales bacterium]|nr:molybdopterin molybdotransferase MoeA [Candidatus Acidoferrales bacterium]
MRTPLRRVTIVQALDAMAQFPVRRARSERVALDRLDGRTLARPVVSPEDVPAFDRSMVDGFAVIAAQVKGASKDKPVRLRITDEVLMGHVSRVRVEAGDAVAVPTGGAIPDGATGVVKIEDTQARDGDILVFDGEDSEDRVNHARSDLSAGELLAPAGRVVDPALLGTLGAAGVDAAEAFVPPTIGVLVTGDELVSPGAPMSKGQIRESNGSALCAALAALGFAPKRYERVRDERDTFTRALGLALRECDGVLISGGSSVGARDLTPQLVGEAGEPGVIVHGVTVRPGRPVLLAMIGDQPVLGLPGNPVSTLVMFEALAKPILLRMMDKTDDTLPLRATLAAPIEVGPGLEHRVPVRLERSSEGLRATPLIGTSSQTHILAFADGLVIVPLDTTFVAAGAAVDVWPFTRSRTMR